MWEVHTVSRLGLEHRASDSEQAVSTLFASPGWTSVSSCGARPSVAFARIHDWIARRGSRAARHLHPSPHRHGCVWDGAVLEGGFVCQRDHARLGASRRRSFESDHGDPAGRTCYAEWYSSASNSAITAIPGWLCPMHSILAALFMGNACASGTSCWSRQNTGFQVRSRWVGGRDSDSAAMMARRPSNVQDQNAVAKVGGEAKAPILQKGMAQSKHANNGDQHDLKIKPILQGSGRMP